MKIRHADIVIPKNDPFANCKLKRKQYAEILTNIVDSYTDGFVMALNNKWGTGKTTFVKMWKQHLENSNFKTLYFNAWENDFEKDVLVALISELEDLKEAKTEEVFKVVLNNAVPFAKKIVPSILKTLADKYVGEDFVKDLINGTIEVGVDGLAMEIESYSKRKKSVEDFRQSLGEFVKKTCEDRPVVFIIDELDRCRPNYAVEVLEQIKHLFSVEGIVFVLSIDKVQLGNAVRGVYGSDLIDAEEYLRRFIDLEYSIPTANIESGLYCEYLYNYFNFDEFFLNPDRLDTGIFSNEQKYFLEVSVALFKINNLTLRQQEKLFAYARIVLKSFKYNNHVLPSLLILLLYSKFYNVDFYKSVKSKKFSLDELLDNLKGILPKGTVNDENNFSFVLLEALLLNTYNNFLNGYRSVNLIEVNKETKEKTVIVKSRIDRDKDGGNFLHVLNHLNTDWDLDKISVDYLLKKVNLTDQIVI